MSSISDDSNAWTDPPRHSDKFSERLRLRRKNLTARMQRVADYIDENRALVLAKSALELAQELDVSDATVIRTVQALGFEGLLDLKSLLANSIGQMDVTSTKLATTLEQLRQDTDSAVNYVIEEYRQAIEHLTNRKNLESIARAVPILAQAGKIGVFGIGASAILAEYTVRLFSRNGLSAYALNRTGISLAEQLLKMSAGDALIVLIRQNIHREISTAIEEANRLKIPVILITGQRRHALSHLAHTIIVLPRSSANGTPLHGPTLACLEILVLGTIGINPQRSMSSMERLVRLRTSIRSRR